MTVQPILIASDLTSRCDRVIERCATMDAPLILAHVVAGCAKVKPDVRARLEAIARADLRPASLVDEIAILSGTIPEALTRFAAERQCSLIATGVASFDSPKDYILGTTVDYIVRYACQPVLVVKRRAKEPYASAVVATDFSTRSAKAVTSVARLAPGARIRLLHTCNPPFPTFLDSAEMTPYVQNVSEQEMTSFMSILPVDVRSRVERKVAVDSLETLLHEDQVLGRCDLLALGTRARGGIGRAILGSRASDLLTQAICDVLIVR
jgi:nucleotide-binding universal stress UspA family protein